MTDSWLTVRGDGVVLAVKALPGSRRNEVRGVDGGVLKVAVTAAPERGKANQALLTVLAEFLGTCESSLVLLRGRGSRLKQVLALKVDAETVKEKVARLKA